MMTRVYAWAFASREDLARHLEAYERALLCDHKKLGKELEIFTFDDESAKGSRSGSRMAPSSETSSRS